MLRRILSIFLVCMVLSACASYRGAVAYRCEDVDYARHRLIFHPNGRFAVQLVRLDEYGDPVSRELYAGYYRKNFYAYDLKFDHLPPEEIKKIFRGTIGFFIEDKSVYRIEKITANVYVGQCRMRKEG